MTNKTDKIQQREAFDQAIVEESLAEMSTILKKEEIPGFTNILDPLFRACRQIGYVSNLMFLYPENLDPDLSNHEKLREICRYSKIKFRLVSLAKDWWKKDSLYLLAFYNNSPVALINKNGKKYELMDPITHEKQTVNDEIASHLATSAYVFYEPFPPGKLTGFSIIKFCLRQRLREVISIITIGVMGGLMSLVPPYLIKNLFDRVIGPYDSTLLGQIILGLIVAAGANLIFMLTRSFVFLRLTQLVDLKMESAFWDRLLSLSATFFRQFTVGNLIQRLYAVSQIREELGGNAIKVLLSGVFSLFYFFAMLAYSNSLAYIGLAVAASCLVVTTLCVVMKVMLQKKMLAFDGRIRGILVQLISGIAKLRVGGAESRAFAYWEKPFFKFLSLQIQSQKYQNVVSTVTTMLPILSNAVLFLAIINMLSSNEPFTLSIGSIIAFLSAYTPFSRSIFDFCATAIDMINIIPLWDRAKVIIEANPETSVAKIRPGRLDGSVSIDHILFRYQKELPLILNDVSIKAAPGEYIAIVGPSGSGKSTLVRLILGFEIAEAGCIYLSGKDLLELDLLDVRRQIGSVLQNSTLFFGSLYENIACGGIYTIDELKRAVALAGLDEYIDSLPMGFHTVVQSGGVGFSGGQIQKILISRALISNPAILLFDEATSALDNKTQDTISVNIEKLKITRIVVAHRLSSIKKADRIYVMDKGKVVQVGTFEALSQEEGVFKEMVRRQIL